MEEKLISVIIPVYNQEQYLEQCLDSVINQTYKNLEIIIVDDGSTDYSSKICKYYEKLDKRIKYYYKENSGCGETRNYGLDRANGEFIYFLDSDDYIAPEMIKTLANSINESDSFVGITQFFYVRDTIEILKRDKEEQKLLKTPAVWARMFRKEIIDKSNIRFSSAQIGEDLEFVSKLLIYNNKCTYIDCEPLYYYRRHNSSLTKQSNINWLSILDVLESIENYANEQNKYEDFKSLIEFMAISHIYFATMQLKKHNIPEGIKTCLNTLISKYPDWQENEFIEPYFKEQAVALKGIIEDQTPRFVKIY